MASSNQVRARIAAHTWPKSMPLSRNQKIATISTSDNSPWMTRRVAGGLLRAGCICWVIGIASSSGGRVEPEPATGALAERLA
jgi:hypothetical protein